MVRSSILRIPILFATLLLVMNVPDTVAQDAAEVRVGVIGLDTSHSPAFTHLINDPESGPEFEGYRVVAAYPYGSRTIPSSYERIPEYSQQMQEMGVEIVESMEEFLQMVDVVLLETNDGHPHLEQARVVIEAGKPVFIDKPVAGSLADAVAIYRLADEHKVPVFSSSSLRYSENAQAISGGSIGRVLGADTYSPATLEPSHPDLFWYGIHGVEMLYTVMGPGCEVVRRVTAEDADVVVGTWADGRLGVFRGTRAGRHAYGGTAFGEEGNAEVGPYEGYAPLVVEIITFFRTGEAPVSPEETIEIYTFMEAADESKRQDGAPVRLSDVLERAQRAAGY